MRTSFPSPGRKYIENEKWNTANDRTIDTQLLHLWFLSQSQNKAISIIAHQIDPSLKCIFICSMILTSRPTWSIAKQAKLMIGRSNCHPIESSASLRSFRDICHSGTITFFNFVRIDRTVLGETQSGSCLSIFNATSNMQVSQVELRLIWDSTLSEFGGTWHWTFLF